MRRFDDIWNWKRKWYAGSRSEICKSINSREKEEDFEGDLLFVSRAAFKNYVSSR